MKWSFLVGSPGPTKYILCNCDEGDPGAYNDKGILESDPHTLLEGLAIAGYATGASNGIVFIRHGHDGPIERTEKAIEQAYDLGLIGNNILGTDFSFDIEVALTEFLAASDFDCIFPIFIKILFKFFIFLSA